MSQDNQKVPDDQISRVELYNKLEAALLRHRDSASSEDPFSVEYDEGYGDALLDALDTVLYL